MYGLVFSYYNLIHFHDVSYIGSLGWFRIVSWYYHDLVISLVGMIMSRQYHQQVWYHPLITWKPTLPTYGDVGEGGREGEFMRSGDGPESP